MRSTWENEKGLAWHSDFLMKGRVVFIARRRTNDGLCRNYKFSFFKTSLTAARLPHHFIAENEHSPTKKAPSIDPMALFLKSWHKRFA
jgi:hypothetical protein